MSLAIIEEIEAFAASLRAKYAPEVKVVENDVHGIITDAVSYIKVNGLADLEQIAISLVAAMVPGTSWPLVLAAIKAQAIAAGVKLLDGAEAVVAAKAQSDLIAMGTIAPPVAAPAV